MKEIHRSQRSFSESFFRTFNGGYFLWPFSLQRDPKYQCSDSTEITLVNSSTKYSCNSVSENHTSQSSFSDSFFPVLCNFHKTSLSERLLEGKAVTRGDEFTEHKAVSQKASFQLLSEDISLFTITLHGLPNITLQIPQEQS